MAETLVVVDQESREAAAKREVVAGEEAAAADKAAAAKAIKVLGWAGEGRTRGWVVADLRCRRAATLCHAASPAAFFTGVRTPASCCSLLLRHAQDECEGELAVALPLLEQALAALNTLTKADITEVGCAADAGGSCWSGSCARRSTVRQSVLRRRRAGYPGRRPGGFTLAAAQQPNLHASFVLSATSPALGDPPTPPQVKSMKNPPAPVKVVMEAVCHMLGVKPKKVCGALLRGARGIRCVVGTRLQRHQAQSNCQGAAHCPASTVLSRTAPALP